MGLLLGVSFEWVSVRFLVGRVQLHKYHVTTPASRDTASREPMPGHAPLHCLIKSMSKTVLEFFEKNSELASASAWTSWNKKGMCHLFMNSTERVRDTTMPRKSESSQTAVLYCLWFENQKLLKQGYFFFKYVICPTQLRVFTKFSKDRSGWKVWKSRTPRKKKCRNHNYCITWHIWLLLDLSFHALARE
mgnify:CR=1 FL=1